MRGQRSLVPTLPSLRTFLAVADGGGRDAHLDRGGGGGVQGQHATGGRLGPLPWGDGRLCGTHRVRYPEGDKTKGFINDNYN